MAYEGVLGHEFVGTLLDPAGGLPAGSRVVGEINCGCGTCSWCVSGLERHCPQRTVLGILGRDGCFAECVTLPTRNLVAVPEWVPDERAVFAEPLAAVLEIFEQIPIRPMDSVAIVGDGKLGLLAGMVFSLRHTGRVTLIGHHVSKWARVPGPEALHEADVRVEHRGAFDLVVEASGTSAGLRRALEIARPRGTIILKSTMKRAEPVDLTLAVINELSVVGSRCGRLPAAVSFLERVDAPVERLIDTTYPLHQAERAWEHASRPGALKVCLRPSDDGV
jgi:threonine dehydrogenase-like Zn-dependent dehydrogenase